MPSDPDARTPPHDRGAPMSDDPVGPPRQPRDDAPRCLPPDDRWKQTVRAIYDDLHFGPDSVFQGQQRLASRIVMMIEARHPDYFCAATEATDAQ